MTTCTRARAILFLQRSTFLNTVNLIIIGGNGIRNQMFLDTCIVQAERNVTIKKKTMQNIGGKPGNTVRSTSGYCDRVHGITQFLKNSRLIGPDVSQLICLYRLFLKCS